MTLNFRGLEDDDSEQSSDDDFNDSDSSMNDISQDDSISDNESTTGDKPMACTSTADNEDEEEEDEIIKAIKAEKNKPRDHPPTINCEDFIVDISFHPSKDIIALANIAGDVLLYEYNNDESKLINTLELHLKACRVVEFDAEGTTMYTTAKDKAVMATDIATGKLKTCYENAHEEPIYTMRSLNNNKFVTGDDAGHVKLWDIRKPEPIFDLKIGEEHVADMITNEAQKYLVCAGGDGVLTAIDLKASKIYVTSEEYDSELTCMGLFRTETKLLVGSTKGKFYVFNWKEFGYHSDEYQGPKQSIQCMVPITQNIVVSSGEDGIVRANHMFPQRQLGIVGQHSMPVECLDISHDGQYIASCSHNNDVKFWNISYFESIENVIDVDHKQNKRRDMINNLPSSSVKNASDFFSGML